MDSYRFNGEVAIDDDSANSRDALLEEQKPPTYKRRFSNASQSSRDLSDGERRKERAMEKTKNLDDPLNSGSIVGIENGECAVEPWASKSKRSKHVSFNL